MAGYTQVGAAPQSFYLAQIKANNAGKIIEIKLFDPGDVSGNARLYIQSPDGNSYNNVTFSYQADSACVAGRSDACSGTEQAVHPDGRRREQQLRQQPHHHHDPAAGELRQRRADAKWRARVRTRLVEDLLRRHERQRHHDLAGQHRGNPVHLVIP